MKKTLKYLLIIAIFAIVILLGLLLYVSKFSSDDEPLNYNAWILKGKNVEADENGFNAFAKVPIVSHTEGRYPIKLLQYLNDSESYSSKENEPVNLDIVEKFLEENREAYKSLEEIFQYKTFYSPFLIDPPAVSYEEEGLLYKNLYDISWLVQIDFLFHLKNGNQPLDSERFLKFLNFYQNYQDSIDFIAAAYLYYGILDELEDTLRFSYAFKENSEILKIAEQVKQLEIDFAFTCDQAIKSEATRFMFFIDQLKSDKDNLLHQSAFHFKPNQTKNIFIEHISQLDDPMFNADLAITQMPIVSSSNKLQLWTTENSIGYTYVYSFAPSLGCATKASEAEEKLNTLKTISQEYLDNWSVPSADDNTSIER